MIYLYNAGGVEGIDELENLRTVQVFNSGEDTLIFEIPTGHEKYKFFEEEKRLKYDNQYYTIKSIDEQTNAIISCRLDLDDFQKSAVINYREENQNLTMLLNYALTGSGWTFQDAGKVTIRRTTELEAGNVLDLLRIAQVVYRCVFYYDTMNKILTVFPLDNFENKGVYFTDELNIDNVFLRGDSFDFCTRLIPIGADGLRIDSINNGISYVENFEYSKKVIIRVWRDERYIDVQSLKDDAIEKLKVLSKPNRSYKLDVIDLSHIDLYKDLKFKIGDKVTLIDRKRNIRVEHQIAKYERYPDNPEKSKAELAATAKGMQAVVKNLTGLIEGNNVSINIQGRKISKLTLDIEAFTLELGNYYTRGETEIYVGSQIQAEAQRINLIVAEQQTSINSLSGTITNNTTRIGSLEVTTNSISASVSANQQAIENEAAARVQSTASISATIDDDIKPSINLKVSQSTYNTDIGNISSRITTAESSITQNTDSINLKVSKSDYTGTSLISMINLTDSEILLEASRINFKGAVMVNNTMNWLDDDGNLYGTIRSRNDSEYRGVQIESERNISIKTMGGFETGVTVDLTDNNGMFVVKGLEFNTTSSYNNLLYGRLAGTTLQSMRDTPVRTHLDLWNRVYMPAVLQGSGINDIVVYFTKTGPGINDGFFRMVAFDMLGNVELDRIIS